MYLYTLSYNLFSFISDFFFVFSFVFLAVFEWSSFILVYSVQPFEKHPDFT